MFGRQFSSAQLAPWHFKDSLGGRSFKVFTAGKLPAYSFHPSPDQYRTRDIFHSKSFTTHCGHTTGQGIDDSVAQALPCVQCLGLSPTPIIELDATAQTHVTGPDIGQLKQDSSLGLVTKPITEPSYLRRIARFSKVIIPHVLCYITSPLGLAASA